MSENATIGIFTDKKVVDIVSELFKEALKITNRRLNELNMPSFVTLKNDKEKRPKEYKIARTIFEASLKQVLNKFKTEIITKVETEAMAGFNDNF